MEEKYLKLRKQLTYLGYTQSFTTDCLPLVESLTSDLLQTTDSLKYYMNVCKEVIQQKDALQGAAEPYKCDNAKLIKENNKLHLTLIKYKEDATNRNIMVKSKIEKLEKEVNTLKRQNENLILQNRDYQLKNICADTVSSSRKSVFHCKSQGSESKDKSKNKTHTIESRSCSLCSDLQNELESIICDLNDCKSENNELQNKIDFIKNQVEHRDKEIKRLNGLFEGGRSLAALRKECCCNNNDEKFAEMISYIQNIEETNENLNVQLKESLSKQHEAMSRAVQLAEECERLQETKEKAENLALNLEIDCNKEIKEKCDMINGLQNRLQSMNAEQKSQEVEKLKKCLDSVTKINENLQMENKKLLSVNKRFEEILSQNQSAISENKIIKKCETCGKIKILYQKDAIENVKNIQNVYCNCNNISRESLTKLIENERKFYESHINEIKNKLSNQQDDKVKISDQIKSERDFYMKEYQILKKKYPTDEFVIELQNKICNLEQRIYYFEKENKILSDKNISLKMEINELMCQKQKEQFDYETTHRTETIIEHLETDLQRAREEIKKLENERDTLYTKLKSALHSNMLNSRDEQYSKRKREEISPNSDFLMSQNSRLQQECSTLKENLKIAESELLHIKTLYNQMKSLQSESDRNTSNIQDRLNNSKKEINMLKNHLEIVEKSKNELEYEIKLLKADKTSLKDNLIDIDKERDKLVMDVDEKTEKISSMQHQIRSKETSIELLENRITELNRKLDLLTTGNATLEHKLHDAQTCSESLSLELDTITKQRDNVLIENRRLQSDLAAVTSDLRSLKMEYDLSRKEVEEMKQQLQHYVDEVRRIEDILSRKEAERTEMLDHFASLSHEATVLESNNHSLENEAATKNIQLQAANEKVDEIDRRLKSRESIIEMQEEKISSLMYEITSLEGELAKQRDAAKTSEQMLIHAQEMCSIIENQKKTLLKGVGENDSEKKTLEHNLEMVIKDRKRLEELKAKDKATIDSLESLLADSRREVIELKISLQESTEEIRKLNRKMESLQKQLDILENESHSSRLRTEEAAKQLQDLQFQMTDERYQRVTSHNKQTSDRLYSTN